MKHRSPSVCCWLLIFCWAVEGRSLLGQNPTVDVAVNAPSHAISPYLYGAFFEDINRASDGGLYAEKIQNRSFEDAPQPIAWTLLKGASATASMALDTSVPLNGNNPTSLRLDITNTGGSRVGVINQGFKGTPFTGSTTNTDSNLVANWITNHANSAANQTQGVSVVQGKIYQFSLYARSGNGFQGNLTATLEKQDGTILGSQTISGLVAGWQKFTASFTATGTDSNARLVIAATSVGSVWLDMVSLFPQETFKNRPNGLRPDLAQLIADMKPATFRFPGGSYLEAGYIKDAWHWKDTIGDVAQRKPNWNIWGYMASNGLGYHEFLQFCEDIGTEPLLVVNCGMGEKEFVAPAAIGPWVQEALDAIEYANGPTTSTWGAARAANGHPAPFNLKFIEIGNENGRSYSWGGGNLQEYTDRYTYFYQAIKAAYPCVTPIANVNVVGQSDMVDDHWYSNASWFRQNSTMYDNYPRSSPPIYVGEYADTADKYNVTAAVAEAAYMTGMERNSDIVLTSCYAPLMTTAYWEEWSPNLIQFNNTAAFGSPSYHVQKMFASNVGTVVLPSAINATATAPAGKIGLSTWSTAAEFANLKVVDTNNSTLYQSNFAGNGTSGWTFQGGTWSVQPASGTTPVRLRQANNSGTDLRGTYGNTAWSSYTYTLQARKISGNEGFLIMFNVVDDNNYCWWNIGGWGNTAHGVEQCVNGNKTTVVKTSGSVATNTWYNIQITIAGSNVTCSLNGTVVHNFTLPATTSFYTAASLLPGTKEIIIKAVNPSGSTITPTFKLTGVSSIDASTPSTVLSSGSGGNTNSFTTPANVAPVNGTLATSAPNFTASLPPYSVSVLRVKANTLPPLPPFAPTALKITATNSAVVLTWTAPDGLPITGYNIKRKAQGETAYTTVATGVAGTSWTDTNVTVGVRYDYIVTSVNADGESPSSSSVNATPPYSAYQQWKISNGLPISTPDTAVLTSDGLPLLIKYATGLSATQAAPTPPVKVGDTADHSRLTLTFNRITDPTLQYQVLATDNLLLPSWSEVVWSSTGASNAAGPVTVIDSVLMSSKPVRFLRLQVSH